MTLLFVTKCCLAFGVLPAFANDRKDGQRASTALRQQRRRGMDSMGVEHHAVTIAAPTVEQRLVICNAYASPKALDVTRVSTRENVLSGLAYKQCKDIALPLEEGEQLDFKANGLDVGTFYATGLPKASASLLLIPHRRTPHAVGLSFESHAFSDVQAPQVAVIDAYRGKQKDSAVKIRVAAEDDKVPATPVEERLKFNSVIALNPGKYEVSLDGTGKNATRLALNAMGATKHVVMRIGIDGASPYPQELLVFPNGVARAMTCWTLVVSLVMALSLTSRIEM